jgi:uncharacterized membrane protein
MADDPKKTGTTIVMTAGVPIPVPRRNEKAVRGAAVGGAGGALLAGLFVCPPLAIAVAAASGAFLGAAIGADADRRA